MTYKEFYESLELLVRGSFTKESTLISDKFAEGFCKMLENEDCMIIQPRAAVIDAEEKEEDPLKKSLTQRDSKVAGVS